nr:odorant-binding protein 1 [Psyttalia incisi]
MSWRIVHWFSNRVLSWYSSFIGWPYYRDLHCILRMLFRCFIIVFFFRFSFNQVLLIIIILEVMMGLSNSCRADNVREKFVMFIRLGNFGTLAIFCTAVIKSSLITVLIILTGSLIFLWGRPRNLDRSLVSGHSATNSRASSVSNQSSLDYIKSLSRVRLNIENGVI